MARIAENILFAAEDLAYDVVDLTHYLAWRLRDAMTHDERVEFAVAAVVILVFLVMFGIAGSMDYHDEMSQLAYWHERGVEIARW